MKIMKAVTLIALTTQTLPANITLAQNAEELKDAKESLQQNLYEITGKDTVILKFRKSSTHLSEADISELRTTLNAVKEGAKIKEILVLAYADLPYPHNQKGDLPKASQKLAQKRADTVGNKIRELEGTNIKLYNMATKANWFEKAFVTSSAQIKSEANTEQAKMDADDAFYEALGKHQIKEGGSGKVAVVIRRDFPYSQ